jgi:hypothetical protein
MIAENKLSDYDHPLVHSKALKLTDTQKTRIQKVRE